MTDPALPKKPAGPFRWILLGCGILSAVAVLGMGGCAGIFYFIYKASDPVAEIGADYLRKTPKVQDEFGRDPNVTRHKFGWNVRMVNDGGNAHFTYDVGGNLSTGEATVWLRRSGGKWSVLGARAKAQGHKPVTIGKPPPERATDSDD